MAHAYTHRQMNTQSFSFESFKNYVLSMGWENVLNIFDFRQYQNGVDLDNKALVVWNTLLPPKTISSINWRAGLQTHYDSTVKQACSLSPFF